MKNDNHYDLLFYLPSQLLFFQNVIDPGLKSEASLLIEQDHIVSIVGINTDEEGQEYWLVRNSWGEYWGESGFFRIKTGENQLGIEDDCVWAEPDIINQNNYPCFEDGSNC